MRRGDRVNETLEKTLGKTLVLLVGYETSLSGDVWRGLCSSVGREGEVVILYV